MERIEIAEWHELPGVDSDTDDSGGRQALGNYTATYMAGEDDPIRAVEGNWRHDTFHPVVVEHQSGQRNRIDSAGLITEQG